MNRVAAVIIALGLLVSCAAPADAESGPAYWPRWRGPDGAGTAKDANPPVTWSETENIKWKVKVPGAGSSTPIIWGDKIFFQAAIETDKQGAPAGRPGEASFHGGQAPSNIHTFDVVCLDRKTGEVLWQKTAREELPHEGHHPNHGFASYSPVTDGKHVWANFGSRGVHCYDMDGNLKWSKDLGKLKTRNGFGEGSSPALAGDALIVVMDQEETSYIYALNKDNGEILWKQERDEHTSWATPIPVEVNGTLQVITSATNLIRSYDVKTGDLIWQCSGQTANAIPSPVTGYGMVFCTSGFRGSALQAIKLGSTGDLSGSAAIVWEINKGTPYVPSPILYGENIYVLDGNRAVLSSYEAQTGKPNFVEQRLEGMNEIYASPVGAGGRLYLMGRDGVCQVIENSAQYKVLATNTLDDAFDASPAIAGDELYLKGVSHLYCVAES